jgi:hypothetical protein
MLIKNVKHITKHISQRTRYAEKEKVKASLDLYICGKAARNPYPVKTFVFGKTSSPIIIQQTSIQR